MFVLLISLILLLVNRGCQSEISFGKRYNYVGVFSHNRVNKDPMDPFIQISAENRVNVTITIPFLSSSPYMEFSLRASQIKDIVLPAEVRMPPTSLVSQRSILVQADKPVSVILVNKQKSSSDAVSLLELGMLGSSYVVFSYVGRRKGSFIVIAVPFNNTRVTVETPKEVTPFSIEVRNQTFNVSSELTLTLDTLDSLQILREDHVDLTGTRISADKTIAVFSGHVRTSINSIYADHLVDQMPPTKNLMTEYVLYTPYSGSDFDLLRLVAVYNDTNVTVDGRFTLKVPEEYDHVDTFIKRKKVHHVQSSRPLLAGVIPSTGYYSDAALCILDSVPFTGNKYVFSVPDLAFEKTRVVVIIKSGQQFELTLNEKSLAEATTWYTSSSTDYVAASVAVVKYVVYVLKHPRSRFGAYLIGSGSFKTYSYRLTPEYQCSSESRFKRHPYRKVTCHHSEHVQVGKEFECYDACLSRYGEHCRSFTTGRAWTSGSLFCEVCSSMDSTEETAADYDLFLPY